MKTKKRQILTCLYSYQWWRPIPLFNAMFFRIREVSCLSAMWYRLMELGGGRGKGWGGGDRRQKLASFFNDLFIITHRVTLN